MTQGSLKCVLATVLVVLLAMTGSLAYGQGGSTTSSLSGTVVDTSGAVIPGADIVAKNNATSGESRAVSDATGTFTIQALPPGAYTVTISLMGFKTVSMPDIQLVAAQPANVKAVLQVGQLQETVTVTGATEIVQTESSSVATTLSTKQISTVPLATRNTLDFVAALPGVNTTGTIRNSTVMGLQASATNITIDGINVQDNYLKSSDGFFARINPRMDAVEEVTVSTANPGAESAGQGAVQIRFVTRSGTNKFQGSGYEYTRRTGFNSNYWFNTRDGLPKDEVKVDTYGGRIGGPIKKDRLFFFFNYEEFRQPGTQSRSRTMLTAAASQGLFTWNGGPAAGVNLLALAAANGQTSTADPTTTKLLAALQTAAAAPATLLSTGNPITQTLNFFNVYSQLRRYPTVRMDYNVTPNHRVGVSYYLQQYRSMPDTLNTYDPRFPGFGSGQGQNSDRYSWMANWRWTISANMVSEVRGGLTGGPVKFADGLTKDYYKSGAFADWNGFAPFPSTTLISQMFGPLSSNNRDAPTRVLEDTVSWLKGKHSVNMGASFTQVDLAYQNVRNASSYLSLGLDSNDPAYAMFSTTNFPGASTTDLGNARNLYALMTGRVTAMTGSAYLNGSTGKYVYLGDADQLAHERELGFFVQDSWKIRPNLTLSYGIRYELQMPFIMDNAYFSRPLNFCNTYGVSGCAADGLTANLWAPGVTNGTPSQLRAFATKEPAYNTPTKNWAPSFGAAWRPHVTGGFLEKLLSADPVFRGGYSKAYTREGIYAVTALYGANPGGSVVASRSMSIGNLVTSNSQLPLLLRNGFGQFGPGVFLDAPAYPMTATTANSVNEFYPDSQTPYAHTFNVSFQRALTKNMAVDVRYVGTRNNGGWWIGGRNVNEYNTIENGFLSEFKLAQANFAANRAAGKGNTFAYTGAGTSPLPIMLAWMNGIAASGASNTANYSGTLWTNTTLYGYLAKMNPTPQSFASYLQTNNATYAANAAKAGLPANFFLVNPGVSSGGAWVTGRPEDSTNNRYDSIQVELRRRMSGGLLVQGSYQYVMRSDTTSFYSVRLPGEFTQTAVAKHAIKANWAYELPFGQGRKWASGVGRLGQMLVGGWSWDGNLRIQSGNSLDFGNVRLVGMSDADLQKEFFLRFVTGPDNKTHVYMLPDDIIQNTIKAYSTDPTSATGYGALGAPTGRYFVPVSAADATANPTGCISGYNTQCTGNTSLHHYVYGPAFFRADISFGKRFELTKRVWADIRVDVFNVFNNIDYFGITWLTTSPTTPPTASSYYDVTSAYRDSSGTNDPGGRLMQLSFRFSF